MKARLAQIVTELTLFIIDLEVVGTRKLEADRNKKDGFSRRIHSTDASKVQKGLEYFVVN